MRLQSLRSKLLLAVFLLVIGSGFAISFLVTRRYSQSLLDAAAAEAKQGEELRKILKREMMMELVSAKQ